MIQRNTSTSTSTSTSTAIAKAFSKAAVTYDDSAILQREVGARLLDLLELPDDKYPKRILDLGSGTGFFANVLQQKFPKAEIIQLDISEKMLQVASNNYVELNLLCCADILRIPLQNNSIDLIFSNCALQWLSDHATLFHNLHSLLSPGGVLLFSSFGPDTLYELKQSFSEIDDYQHVIEFTDMHILGDQLLAAKMKNPLVQRENIVLTYNSVENVLQDLKNTGAVNQHSNKCKSVFTPLKYKKMLQEYEKFEMTNGLYPATFEVIYGLAYGADFSNRQFKADGNTTFVPIESLSL